MNDPSHHRLDAIRNLPCRQHGPVDQDHRQSKPPRGDELGLRPFATRVLRNDEADPVRGKQGLVPFDAKRPARDYGFCVGQRQRFGPVHQPHEVVVLWRSGEVRKMLPSDGKKHPRRRLGESRDGCLKVDNVLPVVPVLGYPWRTLKSQERDAGHAAGLNGVSAHLRSERVRSIDDLADSLIPEIARQPLGSTESANAHFQGLVFRPRRAPGVGEDGVHPGFGQGFGQTASLRRAAQKKDACHV